MDDVSWPHLRRATTGDLAALVALEAAAFAAPWSRGELAGELDHPAARSWIAEDARAGAADGDRAIGYATLRLAGDEVELLRLAVVPAERRRGVAGALLDRALADARRAGARFAHLEVRRDNAAARAFYEGRGWRQADLRRAYYADGGDAVLYARDLSAT